MRKRIAIVIASDVVGGHEFQSAALAKEIAVRHDVVAMLNRECFRALFTDKGLTCEIHDGLFFSRGHIGRQILNGVLRRKEIEMAFSGFDHVVICAGTVESSVTSVFASLFGSIDASLYLPFFYDRRVIFGKFGVLYNVLLRGLMNLYPRIITINPIQAKLISRCYRGEVCVVANTVEGVPLLKLGPSEPRLVFVGRLDHQKRIIELIKALDFAENPYRQFLIIGDGPLREQVESLASNTVYVHVKCMGWVDTQAQTEILRPTDILVLNSAIEGEPTVLREAAVRGMRAIAADIPGVRGVSNRVFRFRGARGLQALLMSPVLIEGGSLRCRKQFRAHVDRSKQVAKIFG